MGQSRMRRAVQALRDPWSLLAAASYLADLTRLQSGHLSGALSTQAADAVEAARSARTVAVSAASSVDALDAALGQAGQVGRARCRLWTRRPGRCGGC